MQDITVTRYGLKAAEYSINIGDYSYLCIFGSHVNGGFLAVTNFGISAEISNRAGQAAYNKDKIRKALDGAIYSLSDEEKDIVAAELAKAIEQLMEKEGLLND